MLTPVISSRPDWASLLARLALGGVMWAHGAQKLLGWFGGYGPAGTMQFFTDTMHLPWLVGALVIGIEFFGALAIIVGWASRAWAAALGAVLLGIIVTSHAANGFFMNWSGSQPGEGYEYFLLMLGLAGSLVLTGSGRYSVDAWLRERQHPSGAPSVA